jgi:small subunit ribosomal protein S21
VEGGVMSMSSITISIDERFPAEKAIKKFKRLCDAYGIVKEYRARSEYKKPSVKTKEKLENADKRRRKTDVRGKTRTKY